MLRDLVVRSYIHSRSNDLIFEDIFGSCDLTYEKLSRPFDLLAILQRNYDHVKITKMNY